MTESEARKKAQEIVWVNWTAGDIEFHAERQGFKIKYQKNGQLANRADLEEQLIEAMTKQFTKQIG